MLVKMYSLLRCVNLFISRLRHTQDLQCTAVLFYFPSAFPRPNTELMKSLKDMCTLLDLLRMEISKCTYLSVVSLFLTNMIIITTVPLFIFSCIPSPPPHLNFCQLVQVIYVIIAAFELPARKQPECLASVHFREVFAYERSHYSQPKFLVTACSSVLSVSSVTKEILVCPIHFLSRSNSSSITEQ